MNSRSTTNEVTSIQRLTGLLPFMYRNVLNTVYMRMMDVRKEFSS